MKNSRGFFSVVSVILSLALCLCLFGCGAVNVKKYELTVNGGELLYEQLDGSYKAGEEVEVKVRITPHENTVAYLDSLPLARAKSSQDDFLTFTFTMPNKPAVLSIENVKGFDEDLLTGFYLSFGRDGNTIESLSKDPESPEAVANYYYSYYDQDIGQDVFTSNNGADVFAGGKTRLVTNGGYGIAEFESETTLYFTYELLDAVAYVDWVYFDQQTGKIRTTKNAGYTLGAVGISSTYNIQNLSDTRYNVVGEEYTATFDSKVTVNFEYTDHLTGVKILEYDGNNQLIKSSDFTGENRSETFTVGASCEYAVIEEEYTVMNDNEHKGEKHYERTLFDKSTFDNGKTLKYPRGDGLISPIYLSVRWAENTTMMQAEERKLFHDQMPRDILGTEK